MGQGYDLGMNDEEILHLDLLESTHWWYLIRKKILKDWLRDIPKGSKILDLGSASGGNTLVMMSLGYDVTSLEYSQVGVDIQVKKGIPVLQADARKVGLPDNSFDACICLDVLEHIGEDSLVLDEIFRILKPGGLFLFSVPEDMSLWSEHDVAVSHIRRYEKSQFVRQIEAAGLSVAHTRSVNVILKPILKLKRKRPSLIT
jgi:SAM-dependent methyltransferase